MNRWVIVSAALSAAGCRQGGGAPVDVGDEALAEPSAADSDIFCARGEPSLCDSKENCEARRAALNMDEPCTAAREVYCYAVAPGYGGIQAVCYRDAGDCNTSSVGARLVGDVVLTTCERKSALDLLIEEGVLGDTIAATWIPESAVREEHCVWFTQKMERGQPLGVCLGDRDECEEKRTKLSVKAGPCKTVKSPYCTFDAVTAGSYCFPTKEDCAAFSAVQEKGGKSLGMCRWR